MASRLPLVLEGAQVEQLPDGDFVQLGKLNIGPAQLVEVVSPVITATSSHMEVNSGVSQTVDTINGGDSSDILFIHGQAGTAKINFDLGGNLILKKKRTVEGLGDVLLLLREGGFWYEVSWSN
jgi:hypothetical protein